MEKEQGAQKGMNDTRTCTESDAGMAQPRSLAVLETDLRSTRHKQPRLVRNIYTKIIEILAGTRDPLLEGRSLTQLPRALMELERAKGGRG